MLHSDPLNWTEQPSSSCQLLTSPPCPVELHLTDDICLIQRSLGGHSPHPVGQPLASDWPVQKYNSSVPLSLCRTTSAVLFTIQSSCWDQSRLLLIQVFVAFPPTPLCFPYSLRYFFLRALTCTGIVILGFAPKDPYLRHCICLSFGDL